MQAIEQLLFAALKDLVGSRVAPVIFPQPPMRPTWPAIRYSILSTVPTIDLCGDGDDSVAEYRVQLDAVASTFKGARDLRLDIMDAMRAFDPPATLELSSSDFDEETKTFRELLQYSIHPSSNEESP